MGAISYFITIVLVVTYISTATPALQCYVCNGTMNCYDPKYFQPETVNCDEQYPNVQRSDGQHVCVALDIMAIGPHNRYDRLEEGIYRGCRVMPVGKEAVFCDNLKKEFGNRFQLNSCKYCNTTRCVP